jgi:hypothetical protein
LRIDLGRWLPAPGPTARVGTPVLVLRSPAGELAVDWEATLNDG